MLADNIAVDEGDRSKVEEKCIIIGAGMWAAWIVAIESWGYDNNSELLE